MKAALRVILINILILVPVLYGIEMLLRVRLNVEPRDTYLRLGWRPLMPVWMGEVSSLQDRLGVPMLGALPSSRTFLCDDGYGAVVYKSDHLGFRSTAADYRGGSPYDVVIVGDSFMHGWCHVAGLAEYLRRNGRKVVNTAIAGSHPYQYSAVLREFVARPSPPKNLVLGVYLGNDYGTCSGCEARYSKENPGLKKLYSYSHLLGMHVVNQSDQVDEYLRQLKLLQDNRTRSLISVSTWQILKMGELRHFLGTLFKQKASELGHPADGETVPINSLAVKDALSLLLDTCSSKTQCHPVLVTIPSNEAGEKNSLRAAISATHSRLVRNLQAQYPGMSHIDLRMPSSRSGFCGKPLFDSVGKHLSPSGQQCLNDLVLQRLH